MTQSHRLIPVFAVLIVAVAATPSLAGVRRGAAVFRGPATRGLAARTVDREPGETTARRGFETSGGRGVTAVRDTRYGPGQVSNSVTRTFQNGATSSRSGSVTRAPGSVSWDRTHTGVAGNSQSTWGTIYRTDDGYTRSQGVTTSSGRSLTATKDVSVSDSAITVQRTLTGPASSVSQTNVIGRR